MRLRCCFSRLVRVSGMSLVFSGPALRRIVPPISPRPRGGACESPVNTSWTEVSISSVGARRASAVAAAADCQSFLVLTKSRSLQNHHRVQVEVDAPGPASFLVRQPVCVPSSSRFFSPLHLTFSLREISSLLLSEREHPTYLNILANVR